MNRSHCLALFESVAYDGKNFNTKDKDQRPCGDVDDVKAILEGAPMSDSDRLKPCACQTELNRQPETGSNQFGCCKKANGQSHPDLKQGSTRRGILKAGLASLAGFAALMGKDRLHRAFAQDETSTSSDSETLPTLSVNGQLVDPFTGKPVEKNPEYHNRSGHSAVRDGIANRKWVMVIDLAECDGCEKCTVACQKYHDTPPERQWIRIFKMRGAPGKNAYWFPKPCFHCDDPPCTRVCPVDATFKRQDGIVLIDNERCIGCRFCMAACPYSTRYFNWGRIEGNDDLSGYSPETSVPRRVGTVEKCDFCPDMLRQGTLPHCVTACKMGAILFGDQNEDAVSDYKGRTFRLSTLLKEKSGYRYLEELGTKPRVYYLPSKNPTYDPPVIDPDAAPHDG